MEINTPKIKKTDGKQTLNQDVKVNNNNNKGNESIFLNANAPEEKIKSDNAIKFETKVKTEKTNKPVKTDKSVKTDKPEQTNKTVKTDKPKTTVKTEKTNKSVKTDKPKTAEKEVGWKEGLSLLGKGFFNKVKNMGKAIIKHPIKTLATAAVTTAAIAAAPLIGVTSATAGAAVAIGYAAYAVGKTVAHGVETYKDYKEGRHNEVREDLQELGGDGVDLALSLPFLPKAIGQMTRFVKHGTSTIGFNTELIADLKTCHNVKDVAVSFAKANTKIDYNMITNEMGLKVKPELSFRKDLPNDFGAAFDPSSGELYVNENNLLTPKTAPNANGKMVRTSNEALLRHELEHFQQSIDMVREYGIEGYHDICDIANKNMTGQEAVNFNTNFWTKVKETYCSGENTPIQSQNAQKYVAAWTNRREMMVKRQEVINDFFQNTQEGKEIAVEFSKCKTKFDYMKVTLKHKKTLAEIEQKAMKVYQSDFLEQGAYTAQDAFNVRVVKGRHGIIASNLNTHSVVSDD